MKITKKPISPRFWVAATKMMRCKFAFCARTVRVFNIGALMLYNTAASLSNPTPAPFLNARFPASKFILSQTRERPKPLFFKRQTAFPWCFTGTTQNHHMYIMKHICSQPETENIGDRQLEPAGSAGIPIFVAFRASSSFCMLLAKAQMTLLWSKTPPKNPEHREEKVFLEEWRLCQGGKNSDKTFGVSATWHHFQRRNQKKTEHTRAARKEAGTAVCTSRKRRRKD